MSIKKGDQNKAKGFRGWRVERALGAGHCIFQFVSLRGMDYKILCY
jgi:hypothetical protein